MSGNRIDEQGNGGRIKAVCGKPGAFSHRTGYDRGGGGTEYGLKNSVCPQGHSGGQDRTVILHHEQIDPAEQRCPCSEHDPETEQPVQRCADTEIHQVFHQDIACVFCPCETCFAHGKPCLHKEDQRCAQQYPDRVCGRIRHAFSPLILKDIQQKKAPGAKAHPCALLE